MDKRLVSKSNLNGSIFENGKVPFEIEYEQSFLKEEIFHFSWYVVFWLFILWNIYSLQIDKYIFEAEISPFGCHSFVKLHKNLTVFFIYLADFEKRAIVFGAYVRG